MAIIRKAFCIRIVWRFGRTLKYQHPTSSYFNVFLHGNLLQFTHQDFTYLMLLKLTDIKIYFSCIFCL